MTRCRCQGDNLCGYCEARIDAAEEARIFADNDTDWRIGQDAYERELDRRWGE